MVGCGVCAGLSGCPEIRTSDQPNESAVGSAGSLGFANLHELPHTIGVEVIETSDPVPESQRTLSSSVSLKPDDRLLIPDVFTESVTYSLQLTLDGTAPDEGGTPTFNPFATTPTFLSLFVDRSGTLVWNEVAKGPHHLYNRTHTDP
ncbi:hypothetical protein [Halorientalis sp. IM1011]|uniref:hypothetical protein n=1 Tax=Halorientalis sp. IM1011 TaxID=1932360 RepID=UPI0012F9A22D|nr:hypothetical protein [Halorientalis sp. IM1011]